MAKRREKGSGCVTLLYKKDAAGNRVEASPYFYILYRVGGRRIREATKFTVKADAVAKLQERMGEHGLGIRPAQDVKNVKYDDIKAAYLAECKNKGRTFFKRADGTEYINGIHHLDDFFTGMRATQITTDMLRRFIEQRRKEGAPDPTIRRNLVILRGMLNLARKEGKLRHGDVPYFSMPKDSDPAGEYIEPAQFAKVLAALPESLHAFFSFMYGTGCRLGAAQRITWDMVNADCTEIKVPAAIVKARKPLTLVLAGPMLAPIAAMLRKSFRTDGPVFDSTNYRPEWSKACAKAGLGTHDAKARTRTGVRIHDCRCSAAVNLVDSGVDEDLVMKIGGWKTKAMFSRYNVVNTKRMRDAMIQGGQYVAARAKQG